LGPVPAAAARLDDGDVIDDDGGSRPYSQRSARYAAMAQAHAHSAMPPVTASVGTRTMRAAPATKRKVETAKERKARTGTREKVSFVRRKVSFMGAGSNFVQSRIRMGKEINQFRQRNGEWEARCDRLGVG
jgi:hypothetical protein